MRKCKTCGKQLVRTRYIGKFRDRLETLNRFNIRKYCALNGSEISKLYSEGIIGVSPCKRTGLTGKGNPHFQDKLPTCLYCFTKLKTYVCKNKISRGRFCKKCYNGLQKGTPRRYIDDRLDKAEIMGKKILLEALP